MLRYVTIFLISLLSATFPAVASLYKVNSSSALNIRSSADKKGKVIGSLAPGETVDIESVSKDWGKITHNGKYGFVSMKYLTATDVSSERSLAGRPGPGQHIETVAKDDILWNFSTNRVMELLPDFGYLRGKAGNPDVWFWLAFSLIVVCVIMNMFDNEEMGIYFYISLASFIIASVSEMIYLLSSEEPLSFFSPDIHSLWRSIGAFLLCALTLSEQLNIMVNLLRRIENNVSRKFMASWTSAFVWSGIIGVLGYYVSLIFEQTPDWWWWTICGTLASVPIIAMLISTFYEGGWKSLVIGIPVYVIGLVPLALAMSLVGFILIVLTIVISLIVLIGEVVGHTGPYYHHAYGNIYYILWPDGSRSYYRLSFT